MRSETKHAAISSNTIMEETTALSGGHLELSSGINERVILVKYTRVSSQKNRWHVELVFCVTAEIEGDIVRHVYVFPLWCRDTSQRAIIWFFYTVYADPNKPWMVCHRKYAFTAPSRTVTSGVLTKKHTLIGYEVCFYFFFRKKIESLQALRYPQLRNW